MPKVSFQSEKENFVIMKHRYSTNRKQAKAKRSISSVRAKLLIYLSSDVRVRTFCSNMMPSPTLLPTREKETYSNVKTRPVFAVVIRATRQKRSYKPISGDFRLIVNQKIKKDGPKVQPRGWIGPRDRLYLGKGMMLVRGWIFSSFVFRRWWNGSRRNARGYEGGWDILHGGYNILIEIRFLSITGNLGSTVNDCYCYWTVNRGASRVRIIILHV